MEEVKSEERVRWKSKLPNQREAHSLKKTEIVRAAARFFSKSSYHGTTLLEVATELGVTKQALYYYFPDKQSLLFACALDAHQGACDILDDHDTALSTGKDQLAAVLKSYAVHIADGHLQSIMFLESAALKPEQLAEIMELRDRFDMGIRRLIARGVKDKSLRSADKKIMAFTALGAVNWMARWFKPDGGLSAKKVAEEVVEMVIQGMSAKS
jgi:TetR/AcrR family transcriptional regulator